MKEKCVSVVIPIYNSELYLEKCVNSIINQTYKNIEIILVDDGSTDMSLDVCKKLQKKDDRIKIISTVNRGVANARNNGIENSNGEFLIFVDSDDYINEKLIEKCINNIDKYQKCDVVCYNIVRFNRNSNTGKEKEFVKNIKKDRKFLKKMIMKEKINSPCNKLYRMDIINRFNIRFNTDLFVAEDLLFNIEYFDVISYVLILNEDLYYYYYNCNSVTNNFNYDKYNNLMYVNDIALEKYKNDNVIFNSWMYIRMKNIIYILRKMYFSDFSNEEIIEHIEEIKKKNYIILNTKNRMKIPYKLFNIMPMKFLINMIRK